MCSKVENYEGKLKACCIDQVGLELTEIHLPLPPQVMELKAIKPSPK